LAERTTRKQTISHQKKTRKGGFNTIEIRKKPVLEKKLAGSLD
jgi:hypothetical protein